MCKRVLPGKSEFAPVRAAAGIAWLVRKLSAAGAKLERGQIVLAGSFTRPVDITSGDVCTADFGALGQISVRFE